MINKQLSELALDDMNLIHLDEKELLETHGGSLWGFAKEAFFAGVGIVQDLCTGIAQGYRDGRIQRAINESQSIA